MAEEAKGAEAAPAEGDAAAEGEGEEGGGEGGVKEDESNYVQLGKSKPSTKTAQSMYSKSSYLLAIVV